MALNSYRNKHNCLQAASNGGVEILLVDDRLENLLALESILENENYELIKASSGTEALKILMQGHDFAIILMDVQMPLMDGFETAELIRRNDHFKNVPIIFLTANTDNRDHIFKAYQTGAVDYLAKPISPGILKAKVSVFVELFKKTRKLIEQGESMKMLNGKLEEQSLYVRSLIEAALDPMITINFDGIITDMNEALSRITGLTKEKISGSFFFNYFTNPEIAAEVCKDVFREGSVVDYLLTIKHTSGKLTDVLINGSVCKDVLGNVQGVVIVAREKTLSKYSRGLIEASPDPLITINAEGKITDLNEAVVNMTGISRQKISGTDFYDYFSEPEKAKEVYKEVFEKGYVLDFPLTMRHQNGRLTNVLFNGSVYKGDRGEVLGVVITARDITDRKKFESKLIRAKRNADKARQTAEKAVKAKQQFLSNMSHEIRTPMNAIVGFTKVVLKTDLSEKQKEYLNAIKISGDALIMLVNDILDLAKVDAGKMTFEQIPFKLSESVNNILQLFEAKINEKGLVLIKQYQPDIPQALIGDPLRLNQIIINLVSNAIKFTAKGKITVSVNLVKEEEKNATIEFRISDSGVGIPKNKQESIFDYFQQATAATSRVYGGTGLGLSIVKHLVVSQGGTIKVKSTPGEGSTFFFTLNFAKEKIREKENKEIEAAFPKECGKEKIKVLVAEDVVFSQLLMRTLLEEFGFEADVADDGRIALEKLKSKNYDIVLMDLQMPEMNGIEATEFIRNNLKSDIPIIALTADVTTINLEKCREMGMNDYISKPVDDKLLYGKIQKLLKNNPRQNVTIAVKPLLNMSEQKCINLDFLKQLTQNNSKMIREMIKVYLEETPQLLSNMKQSVDEQNWDGIKTTAHSMLPSFVTMGMDEEFTVITKTIQEYAGKEERRKEIKELLSKIEVGCDKAYKELHHEMAVLEKL
jgi:PAS domain S-box-containing protein